MLTNLCDMDPFVQQRNQSVIQQQQHKKVDEVRPANVGLQTEHVRVRTVGSNHSCHSEQPETWTDIQEGK